MTRIFIDKEISIGDELVLSDDATRHVVQVLRMTKGDPLIVFNGRGGQYNCVIRAAQRRSVLVSVIDFAMIERESHLEITLIQGISRRERMDFSIQKGVELGVHTIVPFQAKRSQNRLDDTRAAKRIRHWQGVIQHACEQCGRNRLPRLTSIQNIDAIVSSSDTSVGIVMSPLGDCDISRLQISERAVRLVVGPEGGLDAMELDRFREAGYFELKLGPRILRTETAAIVGLTLLQTRFGDLH
ncbi:MAG: 16S rRNA (uracil1498-N3)-methyltransferase [Gammaproteobacteria bacterium]|jgi:16S rRNA (uracil1498-N3)-methyltransferase